MWLQTKRAIQDFKDSWLLSEFESKINWITWGSLVIEFDEASLSDLDETYVHLFEKGVKSLLLEPLENSIKNIAIDDLWKSAISDGIKKVILVHDKDNHYTPWFDLNGWVLTLSHSIVYNVENTNTIESAKSELEKFILSQL